MEKYLPLALLTYFALISLISVVLTVYDKAAARHRPKHRIRERTLLLCAAAGGAPAMFLTMLMIRHKTRHAKFMISLPIISIAYFILLMIAYVRMT